MKLNFFPEKSWASLLILIPHPVPLSVSKTKNTEPVFVNLLRSLGIDSQPGGPVPQPYLSLRPVRLHRLGIDSWAPETFTNTGSDEPTGAQSHGVLLQHRNAPLPRSSSQCASFSCYKNSALCTILKKTGRFSGY
jgi:hypothetical protein